jgi:uncharacterized alkaline shock family protein YloU
MENNNCGQIKISNEVIATIANIAALEIEGVETTSTFADKLLKNNGVKILMEEEDVNLELAITVDFGLSIHDTALKVQENVKNTVETMTGLKVSQVNIHVQGINFKKEKLEVEAKVKKS